MASMTVQAKFIAAPSRTSLTVMPMAVERPAARARRDVMLLVLRMPDGIGRIGVELERRMHFSPICRCYGPLFLADRTDMIARCIARRVKCRAR